MIVNTYMYMNTDISVLFVVGEKFGRLEVYVIVAVTQQKYMKLSCQFCTAHMNYVQ